MDKATGIRKEFWSGERFDRPHPILVTHSNSSGPKLRTRVTQDLHTRTCEVERNQRNKSRSQRNKHSLSLFLGTTEVLETFSILFYPVDKRS